MADPLSVAASVVGLIAVAAQITKVITGVIKQTKNAPRRLQETRMEVDDIKRILEQLQAFLMKYSTVSRSRSSLILVEQVVVTLASCVSTFSELDALTAVLASNQEIHLLDKIRWGQKIEPLNDILHRLQMHKQSLSLMLIILTGDSQLEAESKVDQLVEVYQESLVTFQLIASRMQDFLGGDIPLASQSAVQHIPPIDVAQDRQLPPNMSVARSTTGFVFEEILFSSRAYRQASNDVDGAFSIASSAGRTGSWTMLSGLSLSDMSHIGILALPIYPADIENPQYYALDNTTYSRSLSNTSQVPAETSTMRPAEPNSSQRWWKKFVSPGKTRAGTKTTAVRRVFQVPLVESIHYANVTISLANDQGESYIYGYLPMLVGKCGVFLKEKGPAVENIFSINGHPLRLEKLMQIFDTPPRYGQKHDWTGYTIHDAAGLLLRYLKTMGQPVVPYDNYDSVTRPLRPHCGTPGEPVVIEADSELEHSIIKMFQAAIIALLPLYRQLFLYLLDLLAVFAAQSETNKMPAARLAATFHPALLSLPPEQMNAEELHLALNTIVFLADHRDHFLIGMDIDPPPAADT